MNFQRDACKLGRKDFENLNLSDCTGTKPKFRFPAPPRLALSANNSYCSSSLSDSSTSSVTWGSNVATKKNLRKPGFARKLPPMGIFWDIENVCVPRRKSAASVVQKIREIFLENYREVEFVVVCDVKKENPQILQELHDSQVNLIHVSCTSKNAADEKLKQSLRRFGEVNPAPSAIVLISGDINFAGDLSDLRYRKKIKVIVIYQINVAEALIFCANEHYSFAKLTKDLPDCPGRRPMESGKAYHLIVTNLPKKFDQGRIKNRLHMLTNNCGGKFTEFEANEGIAYLKFGNYDLALRAQKRIQGEDVFGNKIKVLSPSLRNYTEQRIKNVDKSLQQQQQHQEFNSVPPPPGYNFEINHAVYPYQSSNVDMRDLRRHQNISTISTPPISVDRGGAILRPINRASLGTTQLGLPLSGLLSVSPMEIGCDQQPAYSRNVAVSRLGTLQDQQSLSLGACALPPYESVHRTSGSLEFKDAEGKGNKSHEISTKSQNNQSVELNITNLDPTIDVKELRRLLTNMIKEYVMILSLNVIVQADGMPVANLRVSSQQEAQYIISQLHRQKLGYKRITISYIQNTSPDPDQLRIMVISILQDTPDKRMPLFKFMEQLESRYHCTISVSEVNKLKDVVKINDEMGSRTISLTQEARTSPNNNLSQTMVPYCIIHCPKGIQNRGWLELNSTYVPSVMISLSVFASKLMMLLNIHSGFMPLLSFRECYEQECHDSLPLARNGVPLEHLITCVPTVEIKLVGPNKNVKLIKEKEQKENNEDQIRVAPSLIPNVNLLCREVVDLLKTMERCQLALTKFIPAYHHHFGRQCRVADYGYTKLLDLFESISHVVQIMGDGTRRVITLTHTAQMRRFTSDLLRVLKVQPNKQIAFKDFPVAYEKVMNKPFSPVEYGLCSFNDLLQEVPENTIVIMKNEQEIFISVPKREQTADELARTKQFGSEIRELSDGERIVSLTPQQSLKILGSQITQIIKSVGGDTIKLEDLPMLYFREYNHPLSPRVYQCESIVEMVEKLSDYVQVIHSNATSLLRTIEMDTLPNILRVRSWALLLNPPHIKELSSFKREYQCCYNNSFSMDTLKEISDVVSIATMNNVEFVSLTTLYIIGAQLYYLICNSGGFVLFSHLEKLYLEHYKKPLDLSSFNISSVNEFYNRFNLMFYVRGSKKKSIVVLNRNLHEHLASIAQTKFDQNKLKESDELKSDLWCPAPPSVSQCEINQGVKKKYSPPKPDTPPTPGSLSWTTPSKYDNAMNFSINVPISLNPTLMGNTDNLLSPAHYFSSDVWNPARSLMVAPEPNELPLPDKLLPKSILREGMSDDSADSGVNSKLENSPSDNEIESSSSEARGTSKKLYGTFLNFK